MTFVFVLKIEKDPLIFRLGDGYHRTNSAGFVFKVLGMDFPHPPVGNFQIGVAIINVTLTEGEFAWKSWWDCILRWIKTQLSSMIFD